MTFWRWIAAFSSVLLPMTPSELPPSVVLALVKFMSVSEMLTALMKLAPRFVMFWIVPPEPAGPVPLTVRPAVVPVWFRTMPFGAPLAEMLRNSSSLAPMVVLATLSAVPGRRRDRVDQRARRRRIARVLVADGDRPAAGRGERGVGARRQDAGRPRR